MSLVKMTIPALGASDWTAFITAVEKQRLGFVAVSLTGMGGSGVSQVAQGSVIEVSGTLYEASVDDPIGGTPVSGLNYIIGTVTGSALDYAYTTVAPVWNTAKQGWYDAGGVKRYIGQLTYDGVSSYTNKIVYGSDFFGDQIAVSGANIERACTLDSIVAAGDPVGFTGDDRAAIIGHTPLAPMTSMGRTILGFSVDWVGDDAFAVAYTDANAQFLYVRVGELVLGAVNWLTAETQVYDSGGIFRVDSAHIHVVGIPEGAAKGKFFVTWWDNTIYDLFGRWFWESGGSISSEAQELIDNGTITGYRRAWSAHYLGNQRMIIHVQRTYTTANTESRVGHYVAATGTVWDTAFTGTGVGTGEPTYGNKLNDDYFVLARWTGGTVSVRVGHYAAGAITLDAAFTAALTTTSLTQNYVVELNGSRQQFVIMAKNSGTNTIDVRVGRLSGSTIVFDCAQTALAIPINGNNVGVSLGDNKHIVTAYEVPTTLFAKMTTIGFDGSLPYNELDIYQMIASNFFLDMANMGSGRIVVIGRDTATGTGYTAVFRPTVYAGIAKAAGIAGGIVNMIFAGTANVFSGLVAGGDYYVDQDNKTIVMGPYSRIHVGKAATVTSLLLNPVPIRS